MPESGAASIADAQLLMRILLQMHAHVSKRRVRHGMHPAAATPLVRPAETTYTTPQQVCTRGVHEMSCHVVLWTNTHLAHTQKALRRSRSSDDHTHTLATMCP